MADFGYAVMDGNTGLRLFESTANRQSDTGAQGKLYMQWLVNAFWQFVPEKWHCYKCNAEFDTGSEMMAHVNECKK